MAEYKDTLNLPTTEFPMKASLNQREPQRLIYWQSADIYSNMMCSSKDKASFILHDGPPYANGHLHCGHALNKILKDIIIKSKYFAGYHAPFIPGWDCHGLPIELNVEKKIGKAGAKVSVAEFRQACRSYANTQIDIQRQEFKRLGVIGDWDNPYVTMDYQYEANIVRALGKIVQNGHLAQGFKPVHWCLDCASALAEAEVDYQDKTSPSIDVAFEVSESADVQRRFNADGIIDKIDFPIWTTTPWTLPANEAVCLHPELQYDLVLIENTDRALVIASELKESVLARYGFDGQVIGCVLGQKLEGVLLQHPFMSKQVPIILGEHVTTDAGTGCVHTAPAHGPDDFLVGQKYQLPLVNPVNANGCYIESLPVLPGLHVNKANPEIIRLLEEANALLSHTQLSHSYPHCWRHKTPIIFRATPQWFISMDKNGLRKQISDAIKTVQFIPEWGEARITDMVEKRPDWCISRQRAWGTPITLFTHKDTGELHPNTVELIEKAAQKIEKNGIEAWFSLDAQELLGEDASHYDKVTDTLDVWFDSGVSHYAVLCARDELTMPASLYLEGSDQHRGWFNSSITTAVAMYGHAPYKTVLTHGYTVDANGHKLSKSKGNYVELDKLIETHGADVIRLWVSSTDYRNEVSLSDEILKRTGDAYRRIRNTARFLLSNLFDFNVKENALAIDECLELDKWILDKASQLQQEIQEAYENYQFHVVYQKVQHFCSMDLGSLYLDVIKDRQYTTSKNSKARRSCQTVMYHIVQALIRWMAPILSFTADEIWQAIPGNEASSSIFLTQGYYSLPQVNAQSIKNWPRLIEIRDEVNKALEETRQSGVIGSGLAAEVIIHATEEDFELLSSLRDELRFFLITSDATPKLGSQFSVEVNASSYEKCERCWHRRADVGQGAHEGLCVRCEGNISGQDENREFV